MSQSMSLNLSQRQAQSLKQAQRLIMSPQMQQAIQLLQLPIQELQTAIDTELAQNPVLEYSEIGEDLSERQQEIEQQEAEQILDSDAPSETEVEFSDRDFEVMKYLEEEFRDHFSQSEGFSKQWTEEDEKKRSFLENSICRGNSLYDHLMNQARETFEEEEERRLAELIIGNLDERGFFTVSLEEIALINEVEQEGLERVLEIVRTFEPQGVGARDLRESLLIQLRCQGREPTLAYAIIEHHFQDLLHNRIPVIQKGLDCSAQEVREAIEGAIARLDLQPGAWHDCAPIQNVTADVIIREERGELIADTDDDRLPSLKVNSKYLRMLEDPSLPEETKEYVKEKLASAKWLLRNIHQRNDTIFRIANYLIENQEEYLRDPLGKLKPLTMKAVAESLELHESTIARAVAGKYVDCPRGLLPLRGFFTNSYSTDEGTNISSHTVKDVLLEIVQNENKKKPFSDDALSKLLKEKGIPCARRTVAKYRKELSIGNASQRKSYI